MEYLWNLATRDHFCEYVSYEQAFSQYELAQINEMWNEENHMDAEVSNDSGTDEELRKSNVVWIFDNPDNRWLYNRIGQIGSQTNMERYGFEILGYNDALQMAEYTEGHFFEWHMDFGPGGASNRKLSISVQLSDSDEYEGGDLQFMINHKILCAPRTKGTVVIFPSFVLHRVTPITKGTRRSIVGWLAGQPYR